jgi:hypothetical protein
MTKKWSGDTQNRLPALQVEPYRLWFEFLKLSLKDETLIVDTKRYQAWGNVKEETFSTWWSNNWRTLFSVDVGVHEIPQGAGRSFPVLSDPLAIYVRIPLYQHPKHSLSQIASILESKGAGTKLRAMPAGQFRLDAGFTEAGLSIHPSTRFLRNLAKVRLLLHLYRFWIQHQQLTPTRRLERMTLSYSNWADTWNRNIKDKKWNRPFIEIPPAIRGYAQYLEKRGNRGKLFLHDGNLDHANDRRQVTRFLTKARRIAENVSTGIFPGRYDF